MIGIDVYDSTWKYIDVIDLYESLIWVDRFNEYGDFELYNDVELGMLELLETEHFVSILDSDRQMIIEDIGIETDEENGNKMIFKGRSLDTIIERRIIWGQKVLTGNFQNGIKTLLNENLIAPTDTNRRIDDFIFEDSTDPAVTGLTVDAQYYGDNLYEAIAELCKSKNIGFKVTRENDKYVFRLYAGADRSYDQLVNPTIEFSENFDNLLDTSYLKSTKPDKNVGLTAGEGDGSARLTAEVSKNGQTYSGMARREAFIDSSTISRTTDGGELTEAEYIEQMKQKAVEYLAEQKFIESFDGQIETTAQYVYGVDYYMGDVMQIANEYGMEAKSRVTEMIISHDDTGYAIYPTFEKI